MDGLPAFAEGLTQEGLQLLLAAEGDHLNGRQLAGGILLQNLVVDQSQVLQDGGDGALCLVSGGQLGIADDTLGSALALDGLVALAFTPGVGRP